MDIVASLLILQIARDPKVYNDPRKPEDHVRVEEMLPIYVGPEPQGSMYPNSKYFGPNVPT